MKAILTGLLWLELEDFTNSFIGRLKEQYSYAHPYEENSVFETFMEHHNRIGIPFGNEQKYKNILPKDIQIEDNRISPKFSSPVEFIGPPLRDYQETAENEIQIYLTIDGTVFNLAGKPGSGKSFMLAYLLSKIKVKTLIIAHLTMLTDQLVTELRENLNADIRVLDKDNLELGDINIATSQFISNRPELWQKIKRNIGLIVVDEAESAASLTTLRILQRAHAKYRIFISATYSRSTDNRSEALLDLSGDKIIELERPDLLKPLIIGVECPETFTAPQNKNLFKRFQTAFYRRFLTIDEKILKVVKSSLSKSRQVLVVSDSIEMQERYKTKLEDNGITAGILNSKTKMKDRKQILVDFDKGLLDVLIGASVLNAGLSIPKISVIIRVSFPNSKEKLIQLIGRALRDYEGKQGAYFVDLQFGQGVFKREQIYKLARYKYNKVTWAQFEKGL